MPDFLSQWVDNVPDECCAPGRSTSGEEYSVLCCGLPMLRQQRGYAAQSPALRCVRHRRVIEHHADVQRHILRQAWHQGDQLVRHSPGRDVQLTPQELIARLLPAGGAAGSCTVVSCPTVCKAMNYNQTVAIVSMTMPCPERLLVFFAVSSMVKRCPTCATWLEKRKGLTSSVCVLRLTV